MTSGFVHAKVHPQHLHANSTSHRWPFSAIAELIDNAYDPDVSANDLWVDKADINDNCCLTFVDNGNGMDIHHMVKMLSFGFCDKKEYVKDTPVNYHAPIGRYGNGFKSGSMRLADDALVFTVSKRAPTACVGLLSQTFCAKEKLDHVVFPMMEYNITSSGSLVRSTSTMTNMNETLKAILDVSPFRTEEDLKRELVKLQTQKTSSGTKIVLFNLKRHRDIMELDFDSDPLDIRNPETLEQSQDVPMQQQQDQIFEYRRSLRRYCSILYIRPRMRIHIRNTRVDSFFIPVSLIKRRTFQYKPRKQEQAKELKIIFGYPNMRKKQHLEDYGVMLYNCSRLIEPYHKLDCQKRDIGYGRGVVGVVDVNDVLEPNHIKQKFNKTPEYGNLKKALDEKLRSYCNESTSSDASNTDSENLWTWVLCDYCNKCRRLPKSVDTEELPEKWHCWMNLDQTRNRCEIPEEELKDEYDVPGTSGTVRGKSSAQNRGKRYGKRNPRASTLTSNSIDMHDESATSFEMQTNSVPVYASHVSTNSDQESDSAVFYFHSMPIELTPDSAQRKRKLAGTEKQREKKRTRDSTETGESVSLAGETSTRAASEISSSSPPVTIHALSPRADHSQLTQSTTNMPVEHFLGQTDEYPDNSTQEYSRSLPQEHQLPKPADVNFLTQSSTRAFSAVSEFSEENDDRTSEETSCWTSRLQQNNIEIGSGIKAEDRREGLQDPACNTAYELNPPSQDQVIQPSNSTNYADNELSSQELMSIAEKAIAKINRKRQARPRGPANREARPRGPANRWPGPTLNNESAATIINEEPHAGPSLNRHPCCENLRENVHKLLTYLVEKEVVEIEGFGDVGTVDDSLQRALGFLGVDPVKKFYEA